MAWWNRPEAKYSECYQPPHKQVIEVEKPSPAREWDKETSAQVAALKTNPGFQALMGKLRLQKHFLRQRLENVRQADIRSVDILQNGLQWLSYLERQVEVEVLKQDRKPPREPLSMEQEEFDRVSKALEVIGRGKDIQ